MPVVNNIFEVDYMGTYGSDTNVNENFPIIPLQFCMCIFLAHTPKWVDISTSDHAVPQLIVSAVKQSQCYGSQNPTALQIEHISIINNAATGLSKKKIPLLAVIKLLSSNKSGIV